MGGVKKINLVELSLVLMAASITLLAYLFYAEYIGVLIVVFSAVFFFFSRSLAVAITGLFNIPLGVAFDYFLRVNYHGFEFYGSNGMTVEYLAILTLFLYLIFVVFDIFSSPVKSSKLIFFVKTPVVSNVLYYPFSALIIGVTFYVMANTRSVFHSGFDLGELKKFSFLEYVALVIFFYIKSARSKKQRWGAILLSLCSTIVMLMTSFRMVSIVYFLSVVAASREKLVVGRVFLISASFIGFVVLSLFSYFRQGVFSVDVARVLGYKSGVLDNTFTGVIETSLIYSFAATFQGVLENLKYLLAVVLPVPNSLIPSDWLYFVDVYERHHGRIPGGGLLSGFFDYFNFLISAPVLIYFLYAMKKCDKNVLAGGMCLILTICVSRWWLYGPYVLFKFLGFYVFLLLVNGFLTSIELRGGVPAPKWR